MKFAHLHHAQHRGRQQGAAAVELAIVVTVMMLMVAGIFEFSRAFWYYNALDKATRDAARFMSSLPFTDLNNSTTYAADLAAAKSLAVTTINGAGLTPAATTSNISISWNCSIPCGGSHPAWVNVAISGYSITLGSSVPFVDNTNGTFGAVTLQPSTTIRYMN